MTENKRFTTNNGVFYTDNETGQEFKSYWEIIALMNTLAEENEQLKQFKLKVLELLDEKIKHYEHKPFSAPVGQPMSVNFDADMDRVARLSELQYLKNELQK